MSAPLAYFISWTTKNSWVYGDERGWVQEGTPGVQEPDPDLEEFIRRFGEHDGIVLSSDQRRIVYETIVDHCRIRKWELHAVNARTNHVHVIVIATGVPPEEVMEQLKAWCSRRLNEHGGCKRKWWTEHGSTKWINDAKYFENAVHYVMERQ